MIISRQKIWLWLVAAIVLLGIATSFSTFRISQDTYRYLFVLDITQSMNVSDMELDARSITRFEFARSTIESALSNLPCGSEIGLGIFTAHRTFVMFTPVEICEHYRALSDMLQKIDWRMAWTARSEVAKGLFSAIEGTLSIPDETRLVFLTDGHEAPPINEDIRPPMRAEAGAVTGFIAGIGGPVPSRIPHLDDNDNIIGYWGHGEVMQIDIHSMGRATSEQAEAMVGVNMTDIARRVMLGQEHLSSLREGHLQELAARTGLDYFRIDSGMKFMEHLVSEKYARRTQVLSDMGWIPASLAFVTLIFCFVVIPLGKKSA